MNNNKVVKTAGLLFCVASFVPVVGTPLLIGSGVVAAGGAAYSAYKNTPELAEAFNRIFKSDGNMPQETLGAMPQHTPPAQAKPRAVKVNKRGRFVNALNTLKKSLW